MEDKTITFKRSVLGDLCQLLPMLFKNNIVTKSPVKLPWGSIAWDSEGYSITIKGGQQVPYPFPKKKERSSTGGETLPGLF